MIDDERVAPLARSADFGRRFASVPRSDLAALANIAVERARSDEVWSEVMDGVVARAYAELLRADITDAVRLRILLGREDLIDSDTISVLGSEDQSILFLRCADPAVRETILRVLLQRDMGSESAELLSEEPILAFTLAIEYQRSAKLNSSWLNVIRNIRNQIRDADIVSRIHSLGDLSTAMYLLGHQDDLRWFGKDVAGWAAMLPNMRRDASETDTLQLFALLVMIALERPCAESWVIVGCALPELRATALRGQLPYYAHRFLDRALPHMKRDDWDINKRMLLALHALHEAAPASAGDLAATKLSDDEREVVFYGLKDNTRKSSLFWW